MKLTRLNKTKAIRRFAQAHGYYQRTVREVPVLRWMAYQEWTGWKALRVGGE